MSYYIPKLWHWEYEHSWGKCVHSGSFNCSSLRARSSRPSGWQGCVWANSKLVSQTPLVSAAIISGLAIAIKARFTSLTWDGRFLESLPTWGQSEKWLTVFSSTLLHSSRTQWRREWHFRSLWPFLKSSSRVSEIVISQEFFTLRSLFTNQDKSPSNHQEEIEKMVGLSSYTQSRNSLLRKMTALPCESGLVSWEKGTTKNEMIKAHFPLPYLNTIGLRWQKRKWRGEEGGGI